MTLRPMVEADADRIFEIGRDPVAVRMAAFTHADPSDREAFDRHFTRIRTSPDTLTLAIVHDGEVVGSIASFVMEGDTEITYWLDRAVWGRGLAGRALAQFLPQVPVRPIFARAAADNAASLRVLERAGFRIIGSDTGWANARGAETEEKILRLDT